MSSWTRRDVLKGGLNAASAYIQGPQQANAIDVLGAMLPDVGVGSECAPTPASTRERLLLDFGWRFALGNAVDPTLDFGYLQGRSFAKTGELFAPSREDFDDRAWRPVNLPHDWAVELPFEPRDELIETGAKPLGRAYPSTSIGWYRRTFEVPATDLGRRTALEFDCVFRDSIVALNGHFLGRQLSSYVLFRYDVTDYVTYGGKNVLVVRVDATGHEGWFYEGAGIYRHAWLTKTSPVHVAHWGTFVTCEVQGDSAAVNISTEVANDSDRDVSCRVLSTVVDASRHAVGTVRSGLSSISSWTSARVAQRLPVMDSRLWSPEKPYLYTLVTTIEVDGKSG